MNISTETKPVPPERKKRKKRHERKPLVVEEMKTDRESILEQPKRGGLESHATCIEKLHKDRPTTVEAKGATKRPTLTDVTSRLDNEVSQTADASSTEEIRTQKEKDADSKQFINHPKANIDGDASNEINPDLNPDAIYTNKDSIENQEEDKISIITQIEINSSDKKGDEAWSKSLKLELGGEIKDNQIQSVNSDFIKQIDKSPDTQKTDNGKEQYPDSLNPFADSASDAEEDQQYIDLSDPGDMLVYDGPLRKTVKQRPSLYPWRPFAGGPREYKPHMIPVRQTTKTRASLYPWRPFGEEEYPEELNPFSEKEISNDEKRIKQFQLCEEEKTKPQNKTQTFDSVGEDEMQDSEEEPTDLPVAKKMGRGRKFFKVVKKKTERFWSCLLRR